MSINVKLNSNAYGKRNKTEMKNRQMLPHPPIVFKANTYS